MPNHPAIRGRPCSSCSWCARDHPLGRAPRGLRWAPVAHALSSGAERHLSALALAKACGAALRPGSLPGRFLCTRIACSSGLLFKRFVFASLPGLFVRTLCVVRTIFGPMHAYASRYARTCASLVVARPVRRSQSHALCLLVWHGDGSESANAPAVTV